MNGRERILATLDRKPTDSLPFMPITMMFAAVHAKVPYLDYATDFRVQVEAQLRVAEDYDSDVVSVISDPACEAADCGANVIFYPDQPPAIDEGNALLSEKAHLSKLTVPDPGSTRRMSNRLQAVALFKERVGGQKLVEGWIEGPMAESADLRGINTVMLDFYDDPDFVRALFEFVLETGLRFAKAQINAGAELIGIGDAAASLIGPALYEEFVFPYEKRMVDGVKALGGRPRLHICGNIRQILPGIGTLGCDIVDVDFLVPMAEAREKTSPAQVLLGNVDPVRVLRDATPETIYAVTAQCHRDAVRNFIVGAGCEVPRDTRPENLRAMLRYARKPSC